MRELLTIPGVHRYRNSPRPGRIRGIWLYILCMFYMMAIPVGYVIFTGAFGAVSGNTLSPFLLTVWGLVSGLVVMLLVLRLRRFRESIERDRDRAFEQLRRTLEEVSILSGLLPICSRCKKIRNSEGYWQQLESYIVQHSDAEFSHSLCEECLLVLYPDIYEDDIDSDAS